MNACWHAAFPLSSHDKAHTEDNFIVRSSTQVSPKSQTTVRYGATLARYHTMFQNLQSIHISMYLVDLIFDAGQRGTGTIPRESWLAPSQSIVNFLRPVANSKIELGCEVAASLGICTRTALQCLTSVVAVWDAFHRALRPKVSPR